MRNRILLGRCCNCIEPDLDICPLNETPLYREGIISGSVSAAVSGVSAGASIQQHAAYTDVNSDIHQFRLNWNRSPQVKVRISNIINAILSDDLASYIWGSCQFVGQNLPSASPIPELINGTVYENTSIGNSVYPAHPALPFSGNMLFRIDRHATPGRPGVTVSPDSVELVFDFSDYVFNPATRTGNFKFNRLEIDKTFDGAVGGIREYSRTISPAASGFQYSFSCNTLFTLIFNLAVHFRTDTNGINFSIDSDLNYEIEVVYP